MSEVTIPNAPDRAQKREIMKLLEDVYDVDAGRYTGNENDDTIAATLGEGIRVAWVSELREEFFGPAGSNDDIATAIADLKDFISSADGQLEAAKTAIKHVEALRDKADQHLDRLRKIDAALSPRVKKRAGVS